MDLVTEFDRLINIAEKGRHGLKRSKCWRKKKKLVGRLILRESMENPHTEEYNYSIGEEKCVESLNNLNDMLESHLQRPLRGISESSTAKTNEPKS